MADEPSFFRRIADRTLEFLAPSTDLSPIGAGSPEDDASAPEVGVRYSRTAEEMLKAAGPFFAGLAVPDSDILKREGQQNFGLFDRLLDDDVAMSCLQQRRLAITSRDWEVTPGDDTDPRSVKAGEDFKAMLDALGFDRATGGLHFAVWYGYAVGEFMFDIRQHDGRLIYWLDDIVVPDRKLFGFGVDGSLRFTANLATFGGEEVPPNKFVAIRTGGTHDFAFYGLGLAHWVYWPVWFKRAALRFWALYLEKLASPTALGEVPETATEREKNSIMNSLLALGRDSAVTVPQGFADKIKFMEAQRAGMSGSTYREFKLDQDEAIMRIVLGQPGTSKATPGGIGSTQADVHADVKAEIVKADADLICDALNNTVAKWLTRWNHGEDVAPPKVFRVLDDEEDQSQIAERDEKLDRLGWRRTDDSFAQVYGEGYERKPEPTAPALPTPGRQPNAANSNIPAALRARSGEFAANDPAPLYVQRKLLNVAEVAAWAKAQGLDPVDDDLYVTVLFSRKPVDWFAMGTDWTGPEGKLTVNAGGPRKVERLGERAIALVFSSQELTWRHDSMIERGASHDFDGYLAHVTIQYQGDPDRDLSTIEPYQGPLEFGPELFEALKVDPPLADGLTMFSAADEEEIDRLTAALVDEADPLLSAFAASIQGAIAKVKDANGGEQPSIEQVRVALLTAFETFDPAALAKATGLAFLAERAAAAAGEEDNLTA